MKKLSVLFISLILLSSGAFAQQAETTQDKTKAEKEKEAQMEKAIVEQKKAMADQKKSQVEMEVLQKEKEAALEDIMTIDVHPGEKPGETVKVITQRGGRTSGSRAFAGPEQFGFKFNSMDEYSGHAFGGDEERTTWDFSKSVKENTFLHDYTFDVEKTASNMVISVNGDCKAGEIRIKIVMPGGKNYSDILIDEFGNLNWRKSFNISETENQDKTGVWKFQVSSTKATGFFKISLQTY